MELKSAAARGISLFAEDVPSVLILNYSFLLKEWTCSLLRIMITRSQTVRNREMAALIIIVIKKTTHTTLSSILCLPTSARRVLLRVKTSLMTILFLYLFRSNHSLDCSFCLGVKQPASTSSSCSSANCFRSNKDLFSFLSLSCCFGSRS